MNDRFHKFSAWISKIIGSPYAFFIAIAVLAFWGFSGFIFGFSEQWQIVINTVTTIITFLIVFLIQNTENRESKATHLKLDEIIRVIKQARNEMIAAEDFPEEKLEKLEKEFTALANETVEAEPEKRSENAKN